MARKPNIVIRYGAAHDSIEVDGHSFDRGALDRQERSKLRKIVVGALEKIGYFRKGGRK